MRRADNYILVLLFDTLGRRTTQRLNEPRTHCTVQAGPIRAIWEGPVGRSTVPMEQSWHALVLSLRTCQHGRVSSAADGTLFLSDFSLLTSVMGGGDGRGFIAGLNSSHSHPPSGTHWRGRCVNGLPVSRSRDAAGWQEWRGRLWTVHRSTLERTRLLGTLCVARGCSACRSECAGAEREVGSSLHDGRWRAPHCGLADEMPLLAVVVTQGAAVVG